MNYNYSSEAYNTMPEEANRKNVCLVNNTAASHKGRFFVLFYIKLAPELNSQAPFGAYHRSALLKFRGLRSNTEVVLCCVRSLHIILFVSVRVTILPFVVYTLHVHAF
jgi:hypothetical protein